MKDDIIDDSMKHLVGKETFNGLNIYA